VLRCTHLEGWEFVAQPGERAVQQLSYWVQVRTNGTAVLDSEVVTSNVLFLVKYAGLALASGLVYSVKLYTQPSSTVRDPWHALKPTLHQIVRL
jgi:hypothetical protein